MSIFYEITPVDTLFFRGSEPLEAGQLISSGMFPPPVSVVVGALRTAVLKQKKVSFADYNSEKSNPEIEKMIGKSGTPAPFSVTAILLKKDERIYAPAPFHWFVDTNKKLEIGKDYVALPVISSSIGKPETLTKLAVSSSSVNLPLVKAKDEAVSLGGLWIRLELLSKSGELTLADGDILTAKELYGTESRTGISLLDKDTSKPTRQVQEGALFTAGHIRLVDGVSIVIGIDKECGLEENGVITLGGEQRVSGYVQIEQLTLPSTGDRYLALSPIKAEEIHLTKVICAGKPTMIAGWDLAKKFHKPTESWFPAGSVFSENINNQCVQIAR